MSLLFITRGWLTWKWDSPIRGLIWEEKWWSPVLQKFDVTWSHFARTSDAWISPTLSGIGIFLMVSALIPWFAGVRRFRWTRWLLLPANFILALDIFSRWVGKDMQVGIFLEYGLQLVTPLVLLIFVSAGEVFSKRRERTIKWLLIIAAALTFTGHGLYAVGYYSVPLEFRMMTTEILALSETRSLLFLKVVGWLDFLVVLLLFIPPAFRSALVYMVCWGGVTAFARVVTYYNPNLPLYGMDPWLAETLVRTPHWLLPLWFFIASRRPRLG
ncbi:hypothetical protein OAF44_03770 [Akkermansiaceae bacterium]|nr:hypothetical protein [Akkermansiaceae bacterium]